MKSFAYESELWLARPLEEVFAFFSDARNLQQITPEWLDFCLLSPGPVELRSGALIEYRLKVHRIPVRWLTEITLWEPPHRFVDEQRRGPYRLWVHEHRFAARDQGTSMTDFVRYFPPGGWLVDRLFVRRDIERIFEFRRRKLQQLFAT